MIRNVLSLSLLAVPLVACTGGERANSGQCPAGEVCSPDTPHGVHFIGNDLADALLGSAFGPAATAVGGTQEIALQYDRGNGVLIALDLPYQADDDGGLGVKVDHTSGSVVTVEGAGSRKNYLRIVDPSDGSLYDRYELAGAAVDWIGLVGTEFESVPAGADIVWATGDQKIGVALSGQVQHSGGPVAERLVDTSMQLALAGSERLGWDELRLPNATAGLHALSVTAGNKPAASLDVEIVDHADAVTFQGMQPATVMSGGSATFCFSAMSSNRYIYGLTWSFNVEGTAVTQGKNALSRNCIGITVPADRTSGTIPVQASAGGQTTNISVMIGASARTEHEGVPAKTGTIRTTSTAGDRAAM